MPFTKLIFIVEKNNKYILLRYVHFVVDGIVEHQFMSASNNTK